MKIDRTTEIYEAELSYSTKGKLMLSGYKLVPFKARAFASNMGPRPMKGQEQMDIAWTSQGTVRCVGGIKFPMPDKAVPAECLACGSAVAYKGAKLCLDCFGKPNA